MCAVGSPVAAAHAQRGGGFGARLCPVPTATVRLQCLLDLRARGGGGDFERGSRSCVVCPCLI